MNTSMKSELQERIHTVPVVELTFVGGVLFVHIQMQSKHNADRQVNLISFLLLAIGGRLRYNTGNRPWWLFTGSLPCFDRLG